MLYCVITPPLLNSMLFFIHVPICNAATCIIKNVWIGWKYLSIFIGTCNCNTFSLMPFNKDVYGNVGPGEKVGLFNIEMSE